MNKEMKIREEVYTKMEKEYNNFIEKIKSKTPEEIIQCSYEKVMKEEMNQIINIPSFKKCFILI